MSLRTKNLRIMNHEPMLSIAQAREKRAQQSLESQRSPQREENAGTAEAEGPPPPKPPSERASSSSSSEEPVEPSK